MSSFTRIVAAAALASVAFVSLVEGSALDNYNLAHHAVSNGHAARAVAVNAMSPNQLNNRALGVRESTQKRCKPKTHSTTKTLHPTTSAHSTTSTSHHAHPTTSVHKQAPEVAKPSPKPKPKPKPAAPATYHPSGPLPFKRGLAWSASGEYLKYFKTPEIGWMYTWGATCPSQAEQLGLECACMLWGSKNLGPFNQAKGHCKYILGMNEPNIAAQSGMTIDETIAMWNKDVRPLGDNAYLVSPALASTNDAIETMQYFLKNCGGDDNCGFKGVGVHFYGNDPEDLIKYVTKMYNAVGHIPIWLTEFNCINFSGHGSANCTKDQVWAFIQRVVEWADSTPWIAAYSAYGFSQSLADDGDLYALMTGNGRPSSLGDWYINED